MGTKCGPISIATDIKHLGDFSDADIMKGVRNHADPEWWEQRHIRDNTNLAYIRRWGTYLRREARRRGLL